MMNNNLTDSEIIKALECCGRIDGYGCEECPYGAKDMCSIDSKRDALDLINRQKAKIEALKMDNKQLENDKFNANMNCEHLQAEIERLKKANGLFKYLKNAVHYNDGLIREFRTKEDRDEAINKMVKKFSDLQTAKAEAYKEFAEKVKENSISIFTSKGIVTVEGIDNLLNELVGEGDA